MVPLHQFVPYQTIPYLQVNRKLRSTKLIVLAVLSGLYMCQAVYGIRNTVFCTIVLAKNTAD